MDQLFALEHHSSEFLVANTYLEHHKKDKRKPESIALLEE